MNIILICEDPGAGHYIEAIAKKLDARKIDHSLFLSGVCVQIFKQNNYPYNPLDQVSDEKIDQWLSKADLLIVGTGENRDSKIFSWLRHANILKKKSIAIVDATINVMERFFTSSGTAVYPSHVIVPDITALTILTDSGIFKKEQILIMPSPYFLSILFTKFKHPKKKTIPPLLNGTGQQRKLLFLGETRTGLNPSQFENDGTYSLCGSGRFKNRQDIVLEEFLSHLAPYRNEIFLTLRPHPKNDPQDFDTFAEKFDAIESTGTLIEQVLQQDLIVGMTTTALVEASLLGLETLSIVPRLLERSWLPTIALGTSFSAATRGEISDMLKRWWAGERRANPKILEKYFNQINSEDWLEKILDLGKP